MSSEGGSLGTHLSQRSKLLGLRLWVLLSIVLAGFTLLILFLLSLRLATSARGRKSKKLTRLVAPSAEKQPNHLDITILSNIPPESKDIKEVVVESNASKYLLHPLPFLQQSLQITAPKQWSKRISIDAAALETMPTLETVIAHSERCSVAGCENIWDGEKEVVTFEYTSSPYAITPQFYSPIKSKPHVSQNAEKQMLLSTFTQETIENAASVEITSGWGQRYTLCELEVATNQFAEMNIVGKGGYGIVYQGIDTRRGSLIAVKNLLNTWGRAEKEFRVEVEAIGRVRHKNLVRLLGYCMEGSHRLLVYEYVNNGNLDQWLHGAVHPLPWHARMKIVLGIAKGLAYLHEDLEPKVVHRDVKSSNILLDKDWTPKISDFGLAKLLRPGMSHVTTRVMGTFGYVAPEYASTGLLTERSDVYSFGVLMMEIITGRDPVDYTRPVGEVNLVDWMKMMVGSRRTEEMADPRLEEKPSGRALKRALLVALRCVDPDGLKRPQMGHVLHMLEADDAAFQNVCRNNPNNTQIAKQASDRTCKA